MQFGIAWVVYRITCRNSKLIISCLAGFSVWRRFDSWYWFGLRYVLVCFLQGPQFSVKDNNVLACRNNSEITKHCVQVWCYVLSDDSIQKLFEQNWHLGCYGTMMLCTSQHNSEKICLDGYSPGSTVFPTIRQQKNLNLC